MTTQPIRTIAFIGLGKMGQPMAANLAKAGFILRVMDRSAEAVQDFLSLQPARAFGTPQEAAAESEALITMLPTGRDVREVLVGRTESDPDAAMRGLRPGAIVIDMSSSAPLLTRETGRQLAAAGVAMLDAPVSGGVLRAREGTLAIMVGGDAVAIERARPVLAAMGSKTFVIGSLGSGHAMKALNNYVSAAGLAAAAEALLVGRHFGLDPAVMTDALNASTGRNNSTENKLKQHILSGTFGSGFSLDLMAKDLVTALELAKDLGVPAPLAERCVSLWKDANAQLGPGADHTEIFRFLERLRER
ncbi:MAG TPA: NAD(P)-dependent oxidoreductase [Candidatus Methylomirabilis sp.]|nr:NAD(P)-dependent oxidoreductase [Candidatus Methylomirabilis sp.]